MCVCVSALTFSSWVRFASQCVKFRFEPLGKVFRWIRWRRMKATVHPSTQIGSIAVQKQPGSSMYNFNSSFLAPDSIQMFTLQEHPVSHSLPWVRSHLFIFVLYVFLCRWRFFTEVSILFGSMCDLLSDQSCNYDLFFHLVFFIKIYTLILTCLFLTFYKVVLKDKT